jgi:hypothetical protein
MVASASTASSTATTTTTLPQPAADAGNTCYNYAHLCLYGCLCLRLHSQQHTILLVPEAVIVRSDRFVQLEARAHSLQIQQHSRDHNANAIGQVCHKVGQKVRTGGSMYAQPAGEPHAVKSSRWSA